jgi:large subunit ribosomal protein L19
MNPLVKKIEEKYIKKGLSQFHIGDTVKVHVKIIEGEKERVQVYAGIVIAKRGAGFSETFTVTRVSFGYANEKIFPNSCPSIMQVEVVRRGKVRKAKLNYLRGKLGKAAKVERAK